MAFFEETETIKIETMNLTLCSLLKKLKENFGNTPDLNGKTPENKNLSCVVWTETLYPRGVLLDLD